MKVKRLWSSPRWFLDRGARRDHAEIPDQPHRRARAHGLAVLDSLGLRRGRSWTSGYRPGCPPLGAAGRSYRRQHRRLPASSSVFLPVARAECVAVERGGEAAGLVGPVRADRGRRDDERRPRGSPHEHHGEGLQRLAEAHVVGQACSGAPRGQARRPLDPLNLVVPQVGLERRRERWIQRLGFAEALELLGPSGVGIDSSRIFHDRLDGVGPRAVEAELLPLALHERREVLDALQKAFRERNELVSFNCKKRPVELSMRSSTSRSVSTRPESSSTLPSTLNQSVERRTFKAKLSGAALP